MKYEISYIEGNWQMIKRDFDKMQKDGWEMAGDIVCKFPKDNINTIRFIIPIKRKISWD